MNAADTKTVQNPRMHCEKLSEEEVIFHWILKSINKNSVIGNGFYPNICVQTTRFCFELFFLEDYCINLATC